MSKKEKQKLANSNPAPTQVIVHHKYESGYDKTAWYFIISFLKRKPKTKSKALLSFLVNSKQTFQDYDAVILLHKDHLVFRKTVEEAYSDALALDLMRPSFIRAWKCNGITNYICAPECALFGDYEGELYDEKGNLKQEVKDEAIRIIKTELMVE